MKIKTILTILCTILFHKIQAQTQFANNGFEQWIGDSVLAGWQTYNQGFIKNVTPINNPHSGIKSVKLEVVQTGSITTPGVISQKLIYSGSKPTFIKGWYKMNSISGDKLGIEITIDDTNSTTSYSFNDTLLPQTSVFKQFIIPITVQNANAKPNSISIMLGTIGIDSGFYPHFGTSIILDDIEIVTQISGILSVKNSNQELLVFPNPSNTNVNIEYNIPYSSTVEIDLIDIRGILIKKIVHENQTLGRYKVFVSTEEFNKGVYFLRMKNAEYCKYDKLIIN